MMYGFQMVNGRVIQVEAGSLAEAIELAEAHDDAHGSTVLRGRSLDGFDNNAPAGRAQIMERG